MAEKIRKRKFYGVLEDLVDKAADKLNTSDFTVYKSKEEIGREIFKELYARFQNDPTKKQTGFYMDDGKEIGLLSQCQSLQAMLLLASDFGLTFDDQHLVSEDEENLTIREIMDLVIEDIFDRIKTSNPMEYRFDASPYETKLFTVEYSNVEAITWVIPCFLQALEYHAAIGETCKWEKQLVAVISYGLRYINEAFIESEDESSSSMLKIGWNFTKDCQEPSLYYSYTVCECYVTFYNKFKEYLDIKGVERDCERLGVEVPTETKALRDKHAAEYQRLLEKGDPGYHKVTGKKLAQFDSYNEMVLRYREINNGVDQIDGSLYGEMEDKCKRLAHEIWRLTKGGLADEFYYNDLHTTLTEQDIGMATTSDALFNTVYIINIMLDAGVDLDIQKKLERDGIDDEERAEIQRDYNNLFEACQLASQKAIRAYERLKEAGKEYIVEQFLIGFNENFTVHKDLIKDLRKRRMRVFTLMPLLIHTNNLISEYLVKYPQANMKKYLGYILENRFGTGKKAKWIWEKDGYFSCSNYYYIFALGEFYAYYETYERKYIEHYTENEASRAALLAEQEEAMRAPTGEIGQLRRDLQDREKEIEDLQTKLANVETPIEDAVIATASAEMRRIFPDMLCGFLRDAARDLTAAAATKSDCDPAHSELAEAVKSLAVAVVLSQKICNTTSSSKRSQEQLAADRAALESHVLADLFRILNDYVDEVKNSPESRSSFYNQN